MRQRTGRGGAGGGQYSQRRRQPRRSVCISWAVSGLRGSQDVEGGRGQSRELRSDRAVQGCFLGSDLRDREGRHFRADTSPFHPPLPSLCGSPPSVCLLAELQGGVPELPQFPCLTLKWVSRSSPCIPAGWSHGAVQEDCFCAEAGGNVRRRDPGVQVPPAFQEMKHFILTLLSCSQSSLVF